MAPSRNSRRAESARPPRVWKLPADILLQIVARLDLRSLVRCASTCTLLRRDLLSPPFSGLVSQASLCILAYLCTDAKKPLSLVHPTTPAALSFCHNHLSRFLSRKPAGTLLGKYKPLSSRDGLILLQRLYVKNRQNKSERGMDLCVYDPMSGAQTFFSNPPEIRILDEWSDQKYVLLTATDGIDYSFQLLVFDLGGRGMRVHTASSYGTWGVIQNNFGGYSLKKHGEPAILRGGLIHWIMGHYSKQVLSYDVRTRKTRLLNLPSCDVDYKGENVYLATSSDRELLKLLVIQKFMMFVWLQLPVSQRVVEIGP